MQQLSVQPYLSITYLPIIRGISGFIGVHHVDSAGFGAYSVLRGSPNPPGLLNLVNLTVDISRNLLLSNKIIKIKKSVICYWHYSQSAFIYLGCVVIIGRELLASVIASLTFAFKLCLTV
jgi:hypothetical protein